MSEEMARLLVRELQKVNVRLADIGECLQWFRTLQADREISNAGDASTWR